MSSGFEYRRMAKSAGKNGVKAVTGCLEDFKAFIMGGNVIDLAIAVMIGAAFSAIVNSLVADIMGPIIGLASPGGTLEELFVVLRYGNETDKENHIKYPTVLQAKQAGAVTLNYGKFFQTIINFFFVALCLFVIIRLISLIHRRSVTTDWPCPKCKEMVKEGAVRCPHCTAEPIHPEHLEVAETSAGTEPTSGT